MYLKDLTVGDALVIALVGLVVVIQLLEKRHDNKVKAQ